MKEREEGEKRVREREVSREERGRGRESRRRRTAESKPLTLSQSLSAKPVTLSEPRLRGAFCALILCFLVGSWSHASQSPLRRQKIYQSRTARRRQEAIKGRILLPPFFRSSRADAREKKPALFCRARALFLGVFGIFSSFFSARWR